LKEIVTAEDVMSVPPGGELTASPGAIVTPWARELAATRGVRISQAPRRAATGVVALGADHGGFPLKEQIKGVLQRLGHRFVDLGTYSTESVDYPDIALAVARKVARGEARFGVLVDGAGIGSAMAANKVPGVLAAVCVDEAAARNAREHNDANVMTLGAGFVDPTALEAMLRTFLTSECSEERHRRRVDKIRAIEDGYTKGS
jgi:ribose 5-phosphate isomerase B